MSAKKQSNKSDLDLQKLLPAILAAAVLVVTFISFSPAFDNGFTNWDDEAYVLENYDINDFSNKNIKKQFHTYRHGNYHPLTMISLMYDYSKVQFEPRRYHAVNIYLHLINTLLVFILIFVISKRAGPAFFVSLLFGIHPMHVESVAWIAERKDVLFSMFFLSSLIAYLFYVTKEKYRMIYMVLSLALFVCAILSKPAALTLAPLIIGIDYYYGRKLNLKLILEKLPFFILAIIFGLEAISAQNATNSIAEYEIFTLIQRIMFACYGLIAYVGKMFWPVVLSNFHPYPNLIGDNLDRLPYIYYASPFIVLAAIGIIIYSMKKTRVIVFGFYFYAVNLVMVLQLISVGNAIIAERYTYIPYIGLFFIIVHYTFKLYDNEEKKVKQLGQGIMALMLLSSVWMVGKTREQCQVWKNSETLWTNFLIHYPYKPLGYNSRGTYYVKNNEIDKAYQDFKTIVKINPKGAKPYVSMGNIHGMKQEYDKALENYSKAIKNDDTFFEAYLNRAITLSMMQRYNDALKDYNKAQELDPTSLPIYQNRSSVYMSAKKYLKAVEDYNVLIKAQPRTTSYYFQRGMAYFNAKNVDAAIKDFVYTSKVKPQHKQAVYNLGLCYNEKGEFKKALQLVEKAKAMGLEINEQFYKELKTRAG